MPLWLPAGVIRAASTLDEPRTVRVALSTKLTALRGLGDRKEAAAIAEDLLSAIREPVNPEQRRQVARALITKAWAARQSGHAEAGLADVEQAMTIGEESGFDEIVWDGLGERAELLCALGRTKEARDVYADVIARFRTSSDSAA